MESLIGKKVEIISNIGGNMFNIGDIVQVLSKEDEDSYIAINKKGDKWYIGKDDFKLLNESELTNNQQISRRDYFAAAALQGILAKRFDEPGEGVAEIILDAIEYADLLIKQLDKE